jgi:hypothetical protein
MWKIGWYSMLGVGLFAIGCEQVDSETDATDATDVADQVPPDSQIGAIKRRELGAETFTFIKSIDDEGNIDNLILDPEGEPIAASSLPTPAREPLDRSLRILLDSPGGDELVDIVVALEDPSGAGIAEWTEEGTVTIDDEGRVELSLAGTVITEAELERNDAARQVHIDETLTRQSAARREMWRELAIRYPTFEALPALQTAIERGDASVTLPLRQDQIETFLADNDDILAAIDLADTPADLLAAALLDTTLDPWAIGFEGRRGAGIGVYMSETGCPNADHISSYMRLAGVPSDHSMNVSAIIRGASPESFVYCRSGHALPSAADLLGYEGNPRVHIETHSWAYSLSDNDDYTIADRIFDNHVYDTGVAVFMSAGNFGVKNGYVSSPAKALNTISVGNYSDAIDLINLSSSFRDSEIGNEKPELSAPGTSICAGGFCMTGTSMASPHAAGYAADLLGAYAWLRLRPPHLKALMLASSDKLVIGGLEKVGVGGLDFHRAYFNGTNTWYEGANNAFAGFDATDYLPNNGHIDRQVFIDAASSNVRVAISWLNRGTWTHDHRADAHPLGMDLDLCVFDPVGTLKGCSASFDDPFELVSFDPTLSGNYRVRVTRTGNNDVSSKLHMGLAIDWN